MQASAPRMSPASSPQVPVEVGAAGPAGHQHRRVWPTRPSFKAEIRIAETQARDIDLRPDRVRSTPATASIEGKVDPHRPGRAVNGTVTRRHHASSGRAPPRRPPRPLRRRHHRARAPRQHPVRRAAGVRAGTKHGRPVQVQCERRRSDTRPGAVGPQLGEHHRNSRRAPGGRQSRALGHVGLGSVRTYSDGLQLKESFDERFRAAPDSP